MIMKIMMDCTNQLCVTGPGGNIYKRSCMVPSSRPLRPEPLPPWGCSGRRRARPPWARPADAAERIAAQPCTQAIRSACEPRGGSRVTRVSCAADSLVSLSRTTGRALIALLIACRYPTSVSRFAVGTKGLLMISEGVSMKHLFTGCG